MTALTRNAEQWAKIDPKAVAAASPAHIAYLIADAQEDLAELIAEVERLQALVQQQASASHSAPAVPDSWRVMAHTGHRIHHEDRWEVYGPNGGGVVNAGDVRDWAVRGLLDALAAQGQSIAAQSAAGEREGFEDEWNRKYGFNLPECHPSKHRQGDGYSTLYSGHINTAWWGFQLGAAWQRTQAAGVPEGCKLVPVEPTHEMAMAAKRELDKSPVWYCRYKAALRAALAAAPAQPAVRDECCHEFVPFQPACAKCGELYAAAAHPDDAAVDRFAAAMKAKLEKAREKGRGGWDDPAQCSVEFLAKLLVEHLTKGNAGTFEDVANFAMMLHQRGADPQVLADAAAFAQPEVQRLRPVLAMVLQALDRDAAEGKAARGEMAAELRAALAASTGQEVE